MLGCGFWCSGLTAFFFEHVFSFKKSRKCDDNQQITVSHFGEHKRLNFESSKQNYSIISFMSNIKAIFIHAYSCIYTYMCIYTYVHNLQWMCQRCVRWYQRNICITYTAAHAPALRTHVLKCTQHSLHKNAQLYTHTHICICIHIHKNTQVHLWHRPTTPRLKNGYNRLTIYAQT